MKKNVLQKILVLSTSSVSYYVTLEKANATQKYGIALISNRNSDDRATVKSIFFTHEEAAKCCRYLADNDVYPVALNDSLHNIYFFGDCCNLLS